jgi:hypothetical protein
MNARERKRAARRTETLVKSVFMLIVAGAFIFFNKPISQALSAFFVSSVTPSP